MKFMCEHPGCQEPAEWQVRSEDLEDHVLYVCHDHSAQYEDSRVIVSCQGCGDHTEWKERYSLGIYAGKWCDKCWKTSGYRDEPASAFNPMDAGEPYDPI